MITKNSVITNIYVQVRHADRIRKSIQEEEGGDWGGFAVFVIFLVGMIFAFAAFGAQ